MCELQLSKEPQQAVLTPELLKYPDRIAETFNGKTIFITGSTGLVGKVLLEKLLRTCPGIKKIYLLVRDKKGVSCQNRIMEMFKSPLFGLLKNEKSNDIWEKVVGISGDISMKFLGISYSDMELLAKEVDIVYHSAASVRFDEPFRKTAVLNLQGTKSMLDLAKKMKKLQLFVYVSTAYAFTHEKHLKEEVYDPPADPDHILQLLDLLDEDMFEDIKGRILGSYPNAYAFTKALAEGLCNREIANKSLPVMIFRPSIIVPIYKYPLPGWTDNKNGPSGLLIAGGKGVLRTAYVRQFTYADFIPVDSLINMICLVTHRYLNDPSDREKFSVVNATTSSDIKITWKELIDTGRKLTTEKIPLNWIAWIPGGYMTTNYPLHLINYYWKQMLPALIVDAILFCLRIEPVLLRVQNRLNRGMELVDYYMMHQWSFDNNKVLEIRDEYVNPREAVEYDISAEDFDVPKYLINAIIGARRYLLNEPDESFPNARRHLKVMWVVDKIFHIFLYYFLFCVLFKLYYLIFN